MQDILIRFLIFIAILIFFWIVPYLIGYMQNRKLKILHTKFDIWFVGFIQVALLISFTAVFTVISFIIMYGRDFKQHLQF
jgi:hypothetical protein